MSTTLHDGHMAVLSSQTRLPTAAQLLLVAAVRVTQWDIRRRTRKSLRTLDMQMLHDIGLTRFDATVEADKPFWRA